MVWLKFLLSVVIILIAGTRLARYGDAIAEKTGFGRLWIGLVLIALITSMPELVTAVSSAALVKMPDLALGTLLGSCLYNLTIIVVLDALSRSTPILSRASHQHMMTAAMGILLIAIAGGSIGAGDSLSELSVGWVGIPGIIVLVLYLLGARQMFRSERQRQSLSIAGAAPLLYDGLHRRAVFLRFALSAVAIIGAGIWLSLIGDEIAETTGWGTSFVGNFFLAISTSLPELVVATAAVRLGAVDMAVADILGANMLDVVAIIWADISYTKAPILSAVSNDHIITVVLVAIMNALVIIGLRFPTRRKTFIITGWYGPLLVGLYIYGAYALFTSGTG